MLQAGEVVSLQLSIKLDQQLTDLILTIPAMMMIPLRILVEVVRGEEDADALPDAGGMGLVGADEEEVLELRILPMIHLAILLPTLLAILLPTLLAILL